MGIVGLYDLFACTHVVALHDRTILWPKRRVSEMDQTFLY